MIPNLGKTEFLGSRFVHTNLSNVGFSKATNCAIDPRTNSLKKAVFTLPPCRRYPPSTLLSSKDWTAAGCDSLRHHSLWNSLFKYVDGRQHVAIGIVELDDPNAH